MVLCVISPHELPALLSSQLLLANYAGKVDELEEGCCLYLTPGYTYSNADFYQLRKRWLSVNDVITKWVTIEVLNNKCTSLHVLYYKLVAAINSY